MTSSLINCSVHVRMDEDLQAELQKLEQGNLLRRLRGPENGLINFSTNDYLGLNHHPDLWQRVLDSPVIGVGSGASRLVGGNWPLHQELDQALSEFKGTEAALTFSSGYSTALGVIPALVGKGDVVLLDKRSHACLIDGAKLSGATLRVFPHNDLNYLQKLLQKTAGNHRTLILTESVFSMDGDLAPLLEIVALKEKYGAWLMVDEAHATGVFGAHRRGLVEASGMEGRVEVQMGTLSKALGVSGGYIAGSRVLVDYLLNKSRSLIYSTAPSPLVATAALASIRLVQSEEGASRQEQLWARVRQFAQALDLPAFSPIFPLIYGPESAALEAAQALQNRGFFAPAIRYPTVARGRARVRVTLTASHFSEQIVGLVSALPRPAPEKAAK